MTPLPPALPLHKRAFYSIPVIGWLARDVMYGDHDNIYYLLVIVLALVVVSVMTWGLPALVLLCITAVPAMFVTLITIAAPWTPNE